MLLHFRPSRVLSYCGHGHETKNEAPGCPKPLERHSMGCDVVFHGHICLSILSVAVPVFCSGG